MTREIFEKLKQFPTATFAIWNLDYVCSIQEIEKNFQRLHSNVIILGLNPSADVTFLCNFHRWRYDRWYAEAFQERPFAGAYMTDLISYPEASAAIVLEKWKRDKKFRNRNIEKLKKQFKILGVRNPVIVCLGKNTYELLCGENIKTGDVWYIKHPNSYRIPNARETFISEAKALTGKIKTNTPVL